MVDSDLRSIAGIGSNLPRWPRGVLKITAVSAIDEACDIMKMNSVGGRYMTPDHFSQSSFRR
jgi:hypothetical protein